MNSYLLKNGTVVTADRIQKASLLIRGEKISLIGEGELLQRLFQDARVIDVTGKYIFPGGIDIHTHFGLEMAGMRTGDDFYTGTLAAASGGITLVVDFAPSEEGSFQKGVAKRKNEARDAVIDYSFHLMLTGNDDFSLFKKEFPRLAETGIKTVKLFSAYKSRGLYASPYLLREALLFIKELDPHTRILLHAENNDLVEEITRKYVNTGQVSSKYFPLSRPSVCEMESVASFCSLVEETESRGYVVHLSSGKSARIIESFKRRGVDIKAETSINYLFSNCKLNSLPDGYLYTMCPPLRSESEAELLREYFKKGVVDILATDHCAFFKEQKKSRSSDFTTLPFGLGTVEISYKLLLSKVLKENFLTLQQFVEVTSKNPAEVLGIYPNYGDLRPGSWANLVIVDPKGKSIIDSSKFLMGTDYSQFEGEELQGKILYVFSRGEPLVKDGILLEDIPRGRGKFLPL